MAIELKYVFDLNKIKKALFIIWTLCPGQQAVTFTDFAPHASPCWTDYRFSQTELLGSSMCELSGWQKLPNRPWTALKKDFSVLEIHSTQNNWADQPGIARMDSQNVSKWRYLTSGVLIIESMLPAISSNWFVSIIFYKDFDVDMSKNFPPLCRTKIIEYSLKCIML